MHLDAIIKIQCRLKSPPITPFLPSEFENKHKKDTRIRQIKIQIVSFIAYWPRAGGHGLRLIFPPELDRLMHRAAPCTGATPGLTHRTQLGGAQHTRVQNVESRLRPGRMRNSFYQTPYQSEGQLLLPWWGRSKGRKEVRCSTWAEVLWLPRWEENALMHSGLPSQLRQGLCRQETHTDDVG